MRILILTLMMTSVALASDDFDRVVQQLPDRVLSLELVVSKAFSTSDSAEALRAQKLTFSTPLLTAKAPLSTELSASGVHFKNEDQNPLLNDAREADTYSISLKKYFSTGTLFGLELQDNNLQLSPQNSFQHDYETKSKVSLAQNIWRDAFGYSSRKNIKAAELRSEANKNTYSVELENWVQNMVGLYYSALLARAEMLTNKTNYERKQKLLSVIKTKLNRGTAERPDLLHAQSVVAQSRAAYLNSQENLQKIWRELVMNLKFPSTWLEIPAEIIPLAYDQPVERAQKLCNDNRTIGVSAEKSAQINQIKNAAQGNYESLKAATNLKQPELQLIGSYGGQGTDENFSTRSQDAIEFKNPQWTLGMSFKMPFEWYKEKAQIQQARAELERSRSSVTKEVADHTSSWLNNCAKLKTLAQNQLELEKSFKLLQERALLEEKRYQIGRTTTFQVITAGDDAANAELLQNKNKVALNQTSWEIFRLNSDVEPWLNQQNEKFAPFEVQTK